MKSQAEGGKAACLARRRMRQTVLPFARPKRTKRTCVSAAQSLADLPDEILIIIADDSIRTCTRMALTSQDMKDKMVRAARTRKSLRLIVRSPRVAVRAQAAGLFQVCELHLSVWRKTVTRLIEDCQHLPKLTKVSLPPDAPGGKAYACRATSLISAKFGRRVLVENRTKVCSTPWQISSAAFLQTWLNSFWPAWLNYDFNAHHHTPIVASWTYPGDDPLGDSTYDKDSADEHVPVPFI
mmetsp:Transcript_6197/g.12893  ORF Transcript_6197/g.12893 Transcript_6197/m.12893 type:complete len:239 (-) Transcript_6197:219-935(-)